MYVLSDCVDCQIFHYDLDTNMSLTLADRKNTTNQHNQIYHGSCLYLSARARVHKLDMHFPILSTTTVSRKMQCFTKITYHYIIY